MKRHMLALGMLAAGMTATTVAAGGGVARADTDPFNPAVPGIINQLLTQTPTLFVDPSDEGGPSVDSGTVGMYCENLFVRCR